MTFLEATGFRLHYLLEGDPDRPVVLLSNSLGADLSMWDPQMPALLERFRVLRYDTRGHGRSEMPGASTTLTTLAEDAIALLASLGIARAHVCGVSLGGMTAMEIALNAPSCVRSLVLSNTAAKIGTPDMWNRRILDVEQSGLAAIADTVPLRWFTPAFLAESHALATSKAMLLRSSAAGYAAAAGAIRDVDLRMQLHTIAVPTLVLSGTDDLVTPPGDGQALAAGIPGAAFRQVPGAHLSNLEAPAAYNAALLSFLLQESTHD